MVGRRGQFVTLVLSIAAVVTVGEPVAVAQDASVAVQRGGDGQSRALHRRRAHKRWRARVAELQRRREADRIASQPKPPGPPPIRRRIVYLVDASGSMIASFPFVQVEIKRSVSELAEAQAFTVLYFQEGKTIDLLGPGLHRANSANKRRTWERITKEPLASVGSSDPTQALTRAFELEPDMIFLFTGDLIGRGKHELNRQHILSHITKLRGETKAKVHVIQYRDPGNMDFTRKIAEMTGGRFVFVGKRDLGEELHQPEN